MNKKDLEMMMMAIQMVNAMNSNGNNNGNGNKKAKKPRGAKALYEMKSEFNRAEYESVAKELGCLYKNKDGKCYVGATYDDDGNELYTSRENVARVYREIDKKHGYDVDAPKEEAKGGLEDMSKDELIAMIKKLI